MTSKPDIAIIGPGVVGTTLGVLAQRAGYRVAGVAGRNAAKAAAAAGAIGPLVRVGEPAQIAPLGELVLLCVPDDAIATLCRQLADARAFAPGAVVAHCSGALASDILSPARACSAAVGSMHPLQTFPNVPAGCERFAGTFCFCEGDVPALETLMTLAADLHARPVKISSSEKLLYHASAVLASNYLIALLDAAGAMAEKAGITRADAAAALKPLIAATLANVRASGPEQALTGPIARGDVELVARQYADVAQADAKLGHIYRAMGDWTIDLALRKGTIDAARAEKLREALRVC